MAIHASILAWRIPWTEEPGAIVHEVTKSQTRLSDLLSCEEQMTKTMQIY